MARHPGLLAHALCLLAFSMPLTGPASFGQCASDLNGDNVVNAADLAILVSDWGPCPAATSFTGTVFLESGDAAPSTSVVSSLGGSTTTNDQGHFELGLELSEPPTSVTLNFSLSLNGESLFASTTIQPVAYESVNDVGDIVLSSCNAQFEWQPQFGFQGANGQILSLVVHDDGNGQHLYAAGEFTNIDGVTALRVARYDGKEWAEVGEGFNNRVRTLHVHNGQLFAGGEFQASGDTPVNHIARWSGQSWEPVGDGTDGYIFTLGSHDFGKGSSLIAGGIFSEAGSLPAKNIAAWDGQSWENISVGIGGPVYSIASYNTDLYVGGSFSTAGFVVANKIASWDGIQWSAVGPGLSGTNERVTALVVFDDGGGDDLYVGGTFGGVFGVPGTGRIARWDTENWSAVGNNTISGADLYTLCVFDDGAGPTLYAGGKWFSGSVAKWDGGSFWNPIGGGVGGDPVPSVSAIASVQTPSGPSLFIGGDFDTAGSVIANNMAVWTCSNP